MESYYHAIWVIVFAEIIGLNIFFQCRKVKRKKFKEKYQLYHASGAAAGNPKLRNAYENAPGGERRQAGHRAKVQYAYKVGGVSYTTKRYSFGKGNYEKGALYPQYIEVWYDPKHPTEHVTNLDLQRGGHAAVIAAVCILTFFGGIGLLPLFAFLFTN
ncbi:MAG: DUF3592 domain-containing protein [Roseburia sp.]|nr:DUF3592 domain-containing protein [Roseburia sp.]